MASLAGCGTKNSSAQQKASNHIRSHRSARINHSVMNKINYRVSSEKKSYPKLSAKRNHVLVSIKRQRAYIYKGHHVVYTMYVSTGSHNRTPRGTFHIQNERGNDFYSANEHEGAKYYVSFKDHGVYLFHATPHKRNGRIIKSVAKKLGRKPSSHGCVHLSLPDAKWFSSHAPVGMKVVIR